MVQKITLSERQQIFRCLCEKTRISIIALRINRHPASIYREIKRLPVGYLPFEAQSLASLKTQGSKKPQKMQNEDLRKYVLEKIKKYWSPEQISGRLALDYPNDSAMRISYETIYQFIYSLDDLSLKENLIRCLRQRKKRRYTRKRKTEKRGKIPNMISIKQRPKEVDKREVPGHWEGDQIVGEGHRSAIGTSVERTSRFTLIVPLKSNKDSIATTEGFAEALDDFPEELKKSFTYDRGTEMTLHELFTIKTKIPVFFADPHSPWQRGTNENTNGLIRQFFPKKTDFSTHSDQEFMEVQDLLNNRPRKALGFLTPKEVIISLCLNKSHR